MRISIVGLPASGKSTLARAISEKLSIPHIHLDRFWFEAGGNQMKDGAPIEERDRVRTFVRQKTATAIAADSWVSDGLYTRSVQPEIAKRADVIIFLDIPLWRRLFNHAQRIFNPSERHPELNIRHEIAFFLEIIRRQFRTKPKLMLFINEHKDKVIVLKSSADIRCYLNNLE
ncbi:MAG: AAA family ATPase [Candidatus Paceibacterota bacterium]|jgi:adenylate kinase family enzyme